MKLLYSLLPMGILATIINCLIVTFLHWNLVPHRFLLTWTFSLLFLSFCRALLYAYFKFFEEKVTNFRKWNRYFEIGIALSGIIWDLAAFFSLIPTPKPHQLLIAYVLGGMAAGAAGTFAALRISYYGFMLPAVIPQIILFFIEGGQLNLAMMGMLVLFSILISFSAEQNRTVTTSSLYLRIEKNQLINSLSEEKEATNRINNELLKEIERRKETEKDLHAAQIDLEKKVADRTADLLHVNTQLGKSEELYRSIVETSQEGIYVISSDRTISFVNSRMADLLGYRTSDLEYQSIELFIDKNDLNRYSWSGGREIRQINLIHKNGSLITVLESVNRLPLPVGNNGIFLCMVTDISDLKRREEEVRKYTLSLEEKNSELDSFTHSVSHDLRGPLGILSGFVNLLYENYANKFDDTAKDYLKRIIETTRKMDSIIGDLLKLSRISRHQITKVNVHLSTIARSIIDELKKNDLSRTVKVKIKSDMYCNADPGLITIALTNLLGNSWKYTTNTKQAFIEFGNCEKGNQLIFFVKDNGAGFDMTQINKLFKPFQRLHSEKEFSGTGIGLVIVERIIKKHGGKIWAESIPGKGATFYFTLSS